MLAAITSVPGLDVIIYGAIIAGISFFGVMFAIPVAIKSLTAKGKVVQDFHKPERPNIPRPAGPAIIGGIVAAELVLYFVTKNNSVLAILLTTVIAFIIGFIDDKRVMPGWFKPVALIAAAIPLVVFSAHGNNLNLIFDSAYIPILYIPLIFVIIPILGNTINSIDVLNGVVSGFVIISVIPLLASVAIFGSIEVFLAGLPLLFGTFAFYKYHKFPSKIFPGDSGTLLLGAMYGAVAIAGRSEIIGVIALLPAVINSFLFLSSVKRIMEHRQVKARPVTLLEDFKLAASKDPAAPVSLVRLIVADSPLSEKQIGFQIFKLAIFTSLLAFASIVIQYIIFAQRGMI